MPTNLVMNSFQSNFSFLESRWPDLAILAKFAEEYAHTDPASSQVKVRIFAERVVDILYYELGLRKPVDANFRDLLDTADFKRAMPTQIIDFLHYVRKEGNKGAHEAKGAASTQACLRLLENVHKLSVWFYATVTKQKVSLPPYQAIQKPKSAADLLAELKAREKRIKELEELQEKQRSEHPKAPATEESLKKTLAQSTAEADTLGLTEAETRKQLIDSLLVDAGWTLLDKVSSYDPVSGKPQCIREYPVKHQPTPSGDGSVDYVLMGSDGKPIGVIEAKKTAHDPAKGKTKAEEYANGIEKMTGQRPFIYYTNGHEILFWDDHPVVGYPPRRVWGFHDLEKLQYLLFQRKNRQKLSTIKLKTSIAERDYQFECIRRVYECFEDRNHRKALIVMATGTGKTRTAMSLIDGLMRANWVKRVLFLVDRVELQNQAEEDGFKEHLPDLSIVKVSSATKKDKDARVYLATYNAMMNAYSQFNIGFFDLIIADESHRTIYKYYREIFQYFDAFQIGLTATPADYVTRNTYRFFECEDRDPTFYFSLTEAIEHKPPYLVNYEVDNRTSQFLLSGIRYDDLTEEQRAQLEEQDEDAPSFDYSRDEVDSLIMNKETNRMIIRNLMENGIRNADGTRPGKTIIFARKHDHGKLLESEFNDMYPQYRGKVAKLIDYLDDRKEELIKGFKGKKKEFKDLDLAISVDMLDTGIDVPEVVNLVFAKPVYSKIKFWQMIGRGTRLRKDLFGPGKDKAHFLIFDPWRNFEFFGVNPDGIVRDSESRSVPERLFSVRLELLQAIELANVSNAQVSPFTTPLVDLIRQDVKALPRDSVSVRERWQDMERVGKDKFWNERNDGFYTVLENNVRPLMRWRDIQGEADAMAFDIKVTRLQLCLVEGDTDGFAKTQDKVLEDIERLRTNLNQVKQELDLIEAVQKASWWRDITVEKLEEMRLRLRGLMKYRSINRVRSKAIDIIDYAVPGTASPRVAEEGLEAYRVRVVQVLHDLTATNLTLQKIRRKLAVTEADLVALQSLILERVPGLKQDELEQLFPTEASSLDKLIRSIVGMDELTVRVAFERFRHTHSDLKANQLQFLSLVEQEIIKSGGLEVARLYEQPFTNIHTLGLEGVFKQQEADELVALIDELVG